MLTAGSGASVTIERFRKFFGEHLVSDLILKSVCDSTLRHFAKEVSFARARRAEHEELLRV